jgi:VanZ family protein
MARFVKYWGPPLAWAALIFLLSSSSLQHAPSLDRPLADKAVHAVFFAVLALLIYRALFRGAAFPWGRAAVLAMVITSIYGALDEYHQSFVPLRSPELADWVADTIGALLVLVGVAVRQRHRGSRLNRV